MIKTVALTFYMDEIANDLLGNCYLIKNLLAPGLTDELKASIDSPDADETKSIICRATTEALGKVKYLCQRYLKTGRTTDSNRLERISRLDTASGNIVWEQLSLTLYIPNFNTGVTDALKSAIHKYITDWLTYRFLQNQAPEKAGEYLALCCGEAGKEQEIIRLVNSREVYTMRKPSFF